MLSSIVDILNVIDVNNARAITIEFLIRSSDQGKSPRSKIPSDNSQEFVVVNSAISVQIKSVKHYCNLVIGNIELEISDSLLELITVKASRVVVVHDAEYTSETNYAASTSGLNFFTNIFKIGFRAIRYN